jgi:lycopene cyclase domain-containing protein
MGEYTVAAIISVLVVVTLEFAWFRTGILSRPQYWITMAIVFGFQVLVDGWLTKPSAPIVMYRESAMSGIRIGWASPIEDFLFGYALVTLTLLVWTVVGRRPAFAGDR